MPGKKKNLVSVHVYLSPDGEEKALLDRLGNVSSVTGLSVSRVCVMAIRQGLANVEERLLETHQLRKSGGTKSVTK
jgi:Na+-transporting NADH:ubiquinone oxidoreductase subunit NqrC